MKKIQELQKENELITSYTESLERIIQYIQNENTSLQASYIDRVLDEAKLNKNRLESRKADNQKELEKLKERKKQPPIQIMHFIAHEEEGFSAESEQNMFRSMRKFQTVPFSYKREKDNTIGFLFTSKEITPKEITTIWSELYDFEINDSYFLWENTGTLLEWDGEEIKIIKE